MKSFTVVAEMGLLSEKSENSQQLRVSFGTGLRILFPEISGPGNVLFSLSPVMHLHRLLIDTRPLSSPLTSFLKAACLPGSLSPPVTCFVFPLKSYFLPSRCCLLV